MFEKDVQLSKYTTLQVGGPASFFTVVKNERELVDAVAFAKEKNFAIQVIGGGSNVLVSDDGLPGLTIKNEITGWHEKVDGSEAFITIGSGESFDASVEKCVSKGYWGLENLSHIPGSVGAAPVQNIGAYGVEIKDYITEVRVLNVETNIFETLDNESCQFGYRDSIFKRPEGKTYIVTSITCKLGTIPNPLLSYKDLLEKFKDEATPDIIDIRNAVIEIRSKKFPDWTKVGTAGSFFKNPIVGSATYEKLSIEFPELPGFAVSDTEVKIPLGWILDRVCKLKGVTKGNVGTYEGQALVLINNGMTTAAEIEKFAKYISDTVFEKTGITIEWEVTKLS